MSFLLLSGVDEGGEAIVLPSFLDCLCSCLLELDGFLCSFCDKESVLTGGVFGFSSTTMMVNNSLFQKSQSVEFVSL